MMNSKFLFLMLFLYQCIYEKKYLNSMVLISNDLSMNKKCRVCEFEFITSALIIFRIT